ncbi:FAD binding domain-containing protein [Chelatococcus reniformis]|uniref:FAD-binding PCMH-type domain-containing protein n=1 Tax=Chelatococcus reniformis TaxID=1494448 RepID=A0A916TWI2_9HYPH|nr:FAD binding domain-containing protein [Chelatococcus reniformis]GGC45440.1 hypothetical protein GCM10010994_00700 [Chelatococcus reniformis]
MIAHDFDYHAPRSLADALALLGQADAAVLGGGTWLVPNMTYGRQRPSAVVDIRRLGLDAIEIAGDIVVGAGVTYRQVLQSEALRAKLPLLAMMAGQVTGGPQIVGQATLGGSACYANPSSDVPACLVALDATLRLASRTGHREVKAADFYTGAFQTTRRPDEMLTHMVFAPPPGGAGCGYHKLKFSTGSWPIVTAACIAVAATDGGPRHRLAVGGANAVPVLLEIDGRDPDEAVAARLPSLISQEWSDEFAGAGYRRQVAPAIASRALRQARGAR